MHKQDRFKNPNWWEADQLVRHKSSWGIEPVDYPEQHQQVVRATLESGNSRSQVQCPNHMATLTSYSLTPLPPCMPPPFLLSTLPIGNKLSNGHWEQLQLLPHRHYSRVPISLWYGKYKLVYLSLHFSVADCIVFLIYRFLQRYIYL